MSGTFGPTSSSCVGTNFNTNNAASGTIAVNPTLTTNYSISCTGPGGQASGQTTVVVGPPSGTPGSLPLGTPGGTPSENFISADPNPCSVIPPATNCTTYLTWSTVGITAAKVSVSVNDDETEIPFSLNLNCTEKKCPAKWIKADTQYNFNLRNASDNTLLVSTSVTGEATSGTLTSSSPSCTISSGENSCSVNLSWTVTNPIGATTAITARGMKEFISPSVYAGGPTEFIIPYMPSRTFYLYNNGSLLARTTVTPRCALDASWDGAKCMPFSPNATIFVDPAFIFSGDTSDVTWSSSNADLCVGTGTNFDTKNASEGTVTVSPTTTTTYSIVCTKSEVQTQAQATVTIITTEKKPIFKEN